VLTSYQRWANRHRRAAALAEAVVLSASLVATGWLLGWFLTH